MTNLEVTMTLINYNYDQSRGHHDPEKHERKDCTPEDMKNNGRYLMSKVNTPYL